VGDYMPKHFKAKKKGHTLFKKIIYILVIYLAYEITMGISANISLSSSNQEFITALIKDTNHLVAYKNNNKNLLNKIMYIISKIDISNPITIIENSFSYDSHYASADDYSNVDELERITYYIEDPNPTTINNPKVYIYNSHQLENYDVKSMQVYNITPNVMMASYLLKEKLNNLSIPTIVEDSNITEFMRLNNWDYNYSYQASRFYIVDTLSKYPNLDLLIDVHRDSTDKKTSTTNIENKSYAKVLFVVGEENPNYKVNLELANKINNIIKEKYPTLSRGIMLKRGANVNGIYNQDVSPKIILLECGAVENTIEEVMNTMDIMAEIISEYLGG
jgi:stage II sporulation protein P